MSEAGSENYKVPDDSAGGLSMLAVFATCALVIAPGIAVLSHRRPLLLDGRAGTRWRTCCDGCNRRDTEPLPRRALQKARNRRARQGSTPVTNPLGSADGQSTADRCWSASGDKQRVLGKHACQGTVERRQILRVARGERRQVGIGELSVASYVIEHGRGVGD
jgi:hypothetical protein